MNNDITITNADVERWVGQLYLEVCKWKKAAEVLDKKLEEQAKNVDKNPS